MAVIIPEGFAAVVVPHQHAGLARAAVCTFGVSSDLWEGDYEAMCDSILGHWDSTFGTIIDTEVQIGPVTARVGTGAGEPLAVSGTATALGGSAKEIAPPNNAVLVQKRTATGGRRGRGRMYVPFSVGEGEVTQTGRLETTSLAFFQTVATQFREAMADGTVDPATILVLLHDSDGVTPPPAPSPIVSLTVDPIIGSQRRRLGR